MKKLILIILIFPLYFPSIFGQDVWVQKDSMNGPGKSVAANFVLHGHGFVVSGLGDFAFKRKMYSYNPNQDDWDDELSLGGENGDGLERGSATGFAIGGKGYVCLGQGQNNPYLNDLWEYDDVTKAWSQKADFIGTARSQAVGFVIEDFAYVGTGQDINGLNSDFYKYNAITNQWIAISSFPGTPRRQAVGFSMGAQGYVGTGDDGVMKTDFWQYQPTIDTWIQKADFPGTARSGATGWGIFPTAFVATGEDLNFTLKKDVWEYNYFSNTWLQRSDFSGSARKNAFSFVIDDLAYLGSGYDGTFLDDFYCYSPVLGLEETTINFKTTVFPNPTDNYTFIQLPENKPLKMTISIYNVAGKDVSDQVELEKLGNSYRVNVANLTSGHYIYRMQNDINTLFTTGKIVRN
jgi:hypothetical protein